MQTRLRLLMGATALLYFGPLLAGLGGFGWEVVPVFAALFLMWHVILRPQEWPTNLAEWRAPAAHLALAARAAVQLLLVVLLFGIGRGIGGVLGAEPALPVMLPIALSFLSIPLGRMVWNPWQMAETARFADEALARLNTGYPAPPHPEHVARMVRPLAELPPDTAPDIIAAHLAELARYLPHDAIHTALGDELARPAPAAALRLAFILHATDPLAAGALQGHAAPLKALRAAAGDAALLELFAIRCMALLREEIDAWGDCPNASAIEAAAREAGGQAAQALMELAALNQRLAPLNGDGVGDAL